MRKRKYSEQEFIEAVRNSTSYLQVLQKVNIAPKGGNYRSVKRYIQQLSLDTSHFLGQGWSKDRKLGSKHPIDDYLNNLKEIQPHKLKLKLFQSGKKQRICEICLLTSWRNQVLPLELHHLDGNPQNNKLENLQILCPNCHALTSNYRGKNKTRQINGG